MNLNKDQQHALDLVLKVQGERPHGGGVVVIGGQAGTGKTTALRAICDSLGDQFVLAPTGKAAIRAREASGHEALTIHRWAYSPQQDEETGDVEFSLREVGDIRQPGSGVLIVDEASMISLGVFKDLYELCRKMELNLVLVGDSFQLPPVDNTTSRPFSVFDPSLPVFGRVELTEIFRQALDSPVLRAATTVRSGRYPEDGLMELDTIIADKLSDSLLELHENGDGIVLCHRNATRHSLNSRTREALGYVHGDLQDGEPLLVRKNNYRLELYNGEIIVARDIQNIGTRAVSDRKTNSSVFTDFLSVEIPGCGPAIVSDKVVFGENKEVSPYFIGRVAERLGKDLDPEKPVPFLEANLGYCSTVHSAQGSEYPEVLFALEDSIRLDNLDGRRLVYTALTRAKKRVRIFKP